LRKRLVFLPLFLLICITNLIALPQSKVARNTLNFYFIDVEGGAATLIVTPAGESVLLDAGWSDADGRDAKRIQQAMQQAGITAIDHLVVSHYHQDHYSGVPDIARLVTIKRFYDHGKMTELSEDPKFSERYGAYQTAAKNNTIGLKPGDTIPLKNTAGMPPVKLVCVAANAQVISGKSKTNAECATPPIKQEDKSENARSVGLKLSWDGFEFLNLADLTWNISQQLVCPANLLGELDLYQVTHHGGNVNNTPMLLKSLRPTVAVMINGPRKGGHPDTIKWLQELSSLKALYQLHRNVQVPAEQNVAAEFIANPEEQNDAGYMISVSVDRAKRAFTVTNGRTKDSKSFSFK
jgi:competence protein ComEC